MSGAGAPVASVAVLSDIHGVLPALEAVLAEPDVRAADRIVLLGDVAAGPMPVETLDRLVALGDRAVWVRGNADRELVSLARGDGGEIPDPVAPWAATQLRPDQVALLESLPHPVTLAVDGFGTVLFCHGTPRSDDEVRLVENRAEDWIETFSDLSDDVSTVVCGHTHMPFQRLVNRRTVVNPGSIGMNYGGAGAYWALLRDGAVTLRRTELNVEATVAAVVAGSTYPAAQEWAEEYVPSVNSDLDALLAFRGRAGL